MLGEELDTFEEDVEFLEVLILPSPDSSLKLISLSLARVNADCILTQIC